MFKTRGTLWVFALITVDTILVVKRFTQVEGALQVPRPH